MNLHRTRYALLLGFGLFYLAIAFIIRLTFTLLVWAPAKLSLADVLVIYSKGLLYDISVILFFSVLYALYLLVLPERWNNTWLNKILTYTGFSIVVLLCVFASLAEIGFWLEFDSRFNFIAVDYLIYTYEVVNNINESYPLPYLITGILLLTIVVLFLFRKLRVFHYTFHSKTPFLLRLQLTCVVLIFAALSFIFLTNRWADQYNNRYGNELAKNGIYSFFAAFKDNEIDYNRFYKKNELSLVFNTVRNDLLQPGATFIANGQSIRRQIKEQSAPVRPNVIMITIESFSADFMEHFGNSNKLTPFLDSIADRGVLFTDMYATGTRTVRGMEALSLSIPPTPGNSIVRRRDNNNLFCIGTVFKQAGYTPTFFYGGDGYFDNMNAYFGNNGFDIVDRGGRLAANETLEGTHTRIPGKYVQFKNAWGICDEDLYSAVIRHADEQYSRKKLFYDFVMTTSNHRPYTYPSGRIDIPPGTGRDGAVKYTDYAIASFIHAIKNKPWFDNTIIIFVADHCASSAGKNEINIGRYHIPCIIYSPKLVTPAVISKQCSQIDLYPTLWKMLNWSYTSNFYGKNVLDSSFTPRAFISTYQKLGYLTNDTLLILSPQQQQTCYRWNREKNEQLPVVSIPSLLQKSIAYYQSAYQLFKTGGLKITKEN